MKYHKEEFFCCRELHCLLNLLDCHFRCVEAKNKHQGKTAADIDFIDYSETTYELNEFYLMKLNLDFFFIF